MQREKNIRKSYTLYKSTIEDIVDIKTYIKISTGYIKFIMNKVFQGDEIVLPSRMGVLKIVGLKQRIRFEEGNPVGISPNWRKTKELWESCEDCKIRKQLVYNTNEHSDGVRYKFLWSKNRTLLMNKTIYSLRMTRENKREVWKRIIQGQEYISN